MEVSQYGKIRVFISSGLKGMFKFIRPMTKMLLEKTGLFEVYAFEEAPASPDPVEEAFLSYLDDSDVSVFILDNSEPVPGGVMKEYQRSRELNMRSFFFFCSEYSKEQTSIEIELIETGGEKYAPCPKASDIPLQVQAALLENLTRTYLAKEVKDIEKGTNQMSMNDFFLLSPSLSPFNETGHINDYPKTKSVFAQLFDPRTETVASSSNIDDQCSLAVLSLLGFGDNKMIEHDLVLSETRLIDSPVRVSFIERRLEAFNDYHTGNIEACERKLGNLYNEFKEARKELGWYFNDLLIDWNTVTREIDLLNNNFSFESKPGNIIAEEKIVYNYPLVHNNVIQQNQKTLNNFLHLLLDSPFQQRYENLDFALAPLISATIISFIFGSITQFFSTRQILLNFLISQYLKSPNHYVYLQIIKLCILINDSSKLEDIRRAFKEGTNTFTNAEIVDLFAACESIPLKIRSFYAKLLTYSNYGMILSDGEFEHYTSLIFKEIDDWVDSEDPYLALGKVIFPALIVSAYRANPKEVVKKIRKMVNNKFRRWINDALKTLRILMDFDIEDTLMNEIIDIYISVRDDAVLESEVYDIDQITLNLLRKTYGKNEYETLVHYLMQKDPLYLTKLNFLPFDDQDQDAFEENILELISRLEAINEIQGKDGKYTVYANNYFDQLVSMAYRNPNGFSDNSLARLLNLVRNTILNPSQFISEKLKAVRLLIMMDGRFENKIDLEREWSIINENLKLAHEGFDGFMLGTLFQTYLFSLSIIELIIGKNESFYNKLAFIATSDKLTLINSMQLIHTYLSSREKINEKLRTQLIFFAIQQTHNPDPTVRELAVLILGTLELTKRSSATIIRFSEMMDVDSLEVKLSIIRTCKKISKRKDLSLIFEKAKIDNNFIIRKEVS